MFNMWKGFHTVGFYCFQSYSTVTIDGDSHCLSLRTANKEVKAMDNIFLQLDSCLLYAYFYR